MFHIRCLQEQMCDFVYSGFQHKDDWLVQPRFVGRMPSAMGVSELSDNDDEPAGFWIMLELSPWNILYLVGNQRFST